jgi:hypothetical protein
MIRKISVAVSLSGLWCAAALAGAGCSSTEPASGTTPGSSAGTGTASGGSNTASSGATGSSGTLNANGGNPSTGGGGGSPIGPTAGSSGAGFAGSGGVPGTGGMTGTAGTTSGGTGGGAAGGSGGAAAGMGCDTPGLVWKTANKTNFTSYPEPGSAECIQYSGCMYEGEFAACNQTETLDWVKAHNIVAVFPDLKTLKLHDLCLKSGTKTIVVTAIDECGDNDCNGCCTQNKGNKDELIDVESFTNDRWGVDDGPIQWADLGPTKGMGCN